MAKDNRKKLRKQVRQQAFVKAPDSFAMRKCSIEDQSISGICVRIDTPSFLPERFYLLTAGSSGPRRACRVKWRSAREVGAEFIDGTIPTK